MLYMCVNIEICSERMEWLEDKLELSTMLDKPRTQSQKNEDESQYLQAERQMKRMEDKLSALLDPRWHFTAGKERTPSQLPLQQLAAALSGQPVQVLCVPPPTNKKICSLYSA